MSQDEEDEKSKCCSFRSCGRGLRVPGWEAYNKSLDTNPVITKACTSLSGWFLGDFFTQVSFKKKKKKVYYTADDNRTFCHFTYSTTTYYSCVVFRFSLYRRSSLEAPLTFDALSHWHPLDSFFMDPWAT
jgi:hypothetical protein